MKRVLCTCVALGAMLPLMAGPAAPEVHKRPFEGYCTTNVRHFEPGLGKIVRGPELMEDNGAGFALFTIEGTRVRAVGIALDDGITFCILWATLVEGDPS